MRKLAFLIIMLSKFAMAQDASVFRPDSVKKEIKAIGIKNKLKVDGLLNDAEWALSPASPQFTQVEPYQGQKPNHQTQVKVLYNKKFLYLGIFSYDSLGKKAIRAVDFKRDFRDTQHDMVMVSFDGFNDQRNSITFGSNAYGVQRELLSFDDNYYDLDWDGLWRVRTSRTDSGWVAEMAIPWQTLRYPKLTDSVQNWGLNIMRNRRLTNEISALSGYPRSFTSMRMAYAGKLTGLKPPPPTTNIRIQPYFLSSFDKYKGYGEETKPTDTNYKLGGEMKWAINSNTILDLTANTDFAQADADWQVNNVTRFNVFFPERRQFFLENASLFGLGISRNPDESGGNMRIQPFFSRKIGLDDAGNPIPISAGGRLVYRSDKRNFGAILMRQREIEESPGTNFFVGRYSENIGKQHRIGGLLTVKNQPGGSNVVSSIDGFFRFSDSHSLNTLVSQSTSGITGKNGLSAYAQYFYVSNQFKIWWTQSLVTKDYDPGLGFVSRNDVVATTPGIFWWYRGKKLPFKNWLRAYEPSVFPEYYHQASTGKLIEKVWTFYPVWLNLQSGAFFGYSINPTYQYLTDAFEPLGVKINQGKYNYTRHQIYASTDPSKMLNLLVMYGGGTYFNGNLSSGDFILQFAPLPHVSISGRLNRNHFTKVGETMTTTNVDLYSIEGRFALNPRLQLIGFFQKNSENNSQNYNIRFSWEYQPLSYIYLVFNKQAFNPNLTISKSENHSIAKISYLKQF
ncbi:MAG: carbohydrate binding family 9 domain-containing protein [Cytophagaceae bacterium]|nr:carbohydrate binding family 9 domain-containing protein [Cytophagaceae bacterium]MBL0302614.1 carbohydrate binding family 9 domain-containing protein [Cytophagaceae bacterium]MBL0325438.1 carbohydrate binding family 9 domain-containing protein [Cytophagaceae bacterium]